MCSGSQAFLVREVSGSGIKVVVVKVPDHGGPGVVEHPLNDAGGDVFVFAVGLEHGALGVVFHGLRHALIVGGRMGLGVNGVHGLVEDLEVDEFAAAVVQTPVCVTAAMPWGRAEIFAGLQAREWPVLGWFRC